MPIAEMAIATLGHVYHGIAKSISLSRINISGAWEEPGQDFQAVRVNREDEDIVRDTEMGRTVAIDSQLRQHTRLTQFGIPPYNGNSIR